MTPKSFYDALNRIKTKNTNNINQTFNYDSGTYRKGRLYTVNDGSGNTSTFSYDKIGNITQKTSVIENKTYQQYYTYDDMNRLTQSTYPSGHKVNYRYDSVGNVDKVTYQNGSTIQNVVYNVKYRPFGPVKSMSFGNGAVRSLSHDLDYRTTDIYTNNIQDLEYTFDTNNNIKNITNNKDTALSHSFIYDSENRLTRSTRTGNIDHYSYDKVGNRTTYTENLNTPETYNYSGNSNKLSSIIDSNGVTNSVTHNANGQITNKDNAVYTYNESNRLESYTKNGQTTNYLYNPLGQRIRKSSQYGTMHYLYNEAGQLIAEHNSAGTVQKEYIYLNGQVVGLIKNNTRYYVHNDHLGRAERITNQSKGTVWLASNYAFDRAVTTNTIGDYNLGFPGQYYDTETGTYYNYFRDYDPSTGRYLQSDPIGLAGGINTYGYVSGNPVNSFDPFGLSECSCSSAGKSATPDGNKWDKTRTKNGLKEVYRFGRWNPVVKQDYGKLFSDHNSTYAVGIAAGASATGLLGQGLKSSLPAAIASYAAVYAYTGVSNFNDLQSLIYSPQEVGVINARNQALTNCLRSAFGGIDE